MADHHNYQAQSRAQTIDRAEIDQALRSYMLGVYNYMAIALAITGVVALGVATMVQNSPELAQTIYGGPLRWVVMLAPLGMIFFLGHAINKLSVGAAQMSFWIFSALMGLSMSSIFLVYTSASIAQTFFVTAAAFGGLSVYGYVTKRDLSGMGTFLVMGLIGLIIASVVNMFLGSGMLQFAISVIGVLIFAGLTAYDTQKIKSTFDYVSHNGELVARSSISGALSLYLDFINMFQFLLYFLGDRD